MVHSLRWTGRCLSLLTLGLMAACGPDQGYDASAGGESTVARIEGNVIYRERIMLPPGAQVEVQLQDISRADALASVLATVMLTPEGGPPYPFAIEYDPCNVTHIIKPQDGVVAEIDVGWELYAPDGGLLKILVFRHGSHRPPTFTHWDLARRPGSLHLVKLHREAPRVRPVDRFKEGEHALRLRLRRHVAGHQCRGCGENTNLQIVSRSAGQSEDISVDHQPCLG